MALTLVRPLSLGLALATLLAAPAPAQDGRAAFHEAYYLENEAGDLEGALALYRKVADARRVDAELRAAAETAARGLVEELAAADLARLVPAETILYAELDRPGQQLSELLGSLGLLGEAGHAIHEGLAISPLLIEHELSLRAAAVAVTSLRPDGEPDGVLIVNPGRHDGLRGLIDTALPAAGVPIDAIGGHPAWRLEEEAVVCRTSRLVIVSRDTRQIEGVLARLADGGRGSLAQNPRFARALDAGHPALLRFFVNADPLKPMMRMALEAQAARDPAAAMAMNLLDIDSLESLSGHLGVDAEGVALQVALDLAEGHHNVVFDLLRRPTVGRQTLELVPEGAAFFLASAFNPRADVAPIARDSGQRPVVSLLDFGREWFGNVIDAALVGMPPDPSAGPGLPDVALVLRVNDVERSRALWSLVLETASQASGGKPAAREVVGGVEAQRFALQGVPVYLASGDERLVITPSRAAVERSLTGRAGSVASDVVFERALDVVDSSPTMLLAVCPGRCAEMALPFVPGSERSQVASLVDLLDHTALSFTAQHSDTRLAVSMRVHEVPDVSGLVAQALQQRRQVTAASARPAVAAATRAVPQALAAEAAAPHQADPDALRARFESLAAQDDLDGARQVADRIAAQVEDANWLNGFAWQLLTEERYGGRFDAAARVLSLRSNELSDYSGWYYLDTLALAEFRAGNVRKAVELQAKAVQLGEGDGRIDEAIERLQEYTRALKEHKPIVQRDGGG